MADNVLDCQFQADGPNQKWVADTTYIWTAKGWLYVAGVLDLYSRRIVGRSMQESMTSQLVVEALMMAMWRRGRPVAFLYHSDQGRPVQTSSITSSASPTRLVGIRRSAFSVPDSSSKLNKLRSVSTEPAAAHCARRDVGSTVRHLSARSHHLESSKTSSGGSSS